VYPLNLAGSIGVAIFFLLQVALIIGLLVNRAKRLQGEAEATLIADISSKFVNLPPGDVDREIMAAERRICEFLDLDISAIWQWSAGPPGCFTLTHYFSAQDGPQPSMRLSDTDFPWFRQLMLEGRIVPIASLDDMPPEATLDRENCRRLGVKSNLCIPLVVGGEPVGILGLNTTRTERDWPDPLVKRLQLIAQIFTNALARKQADQALRGSEKALLASEARLAAGTELAGLGCYEFDFCERTCFVDDRFFAICGVPAGHHQGIQALEFWMEHLHSGDRPWILEERAKLHDGRIDRISIEYRYLHPTEGLKWIHHLAKVEVRDATGQAIRTYGVVRDITELKRAVEAALDFSGRLLHAQEAERARIAKELHDGLSQNLALLSVELDMFGQRLPEAAEKINARLGEFSQQTKGLSAEVHRIAHGLHPAKLTQLGLAVALKGFCREIEAAHSIGVSFQEHEVPRILPEDVALCLYRVAQEAIQNVVKHSGARHAQIELVAVHNALALTIEDDGNGFLMEAKQSTGSLGLVSMHERVRLVGGEIAVKSQPGEGTCVEVRVPLTKVATT